MGPLILRVLHMLREVSAVLHATRVSCTTLTGATLELAIVGYVLFEVVEGLSEVLERIGLR